MTHDELLTKVDDWFKQTAGVGHMMHHNSCVRFDCDCSLIDNRHKLLHNALRAVVELHKPLRFDWSNPQLCCKSCRDLDKNDFARALYPCPTIQAIEKELE